MYAKIKNGIVEKFPYTLVDLKKENPNTSFPENAGNDLLVEAGAVPVISTGVEYDSSTQIAQQDGCVFNAERQRWETAWIVRDKSPEELQAEADAKAADIRAQRNQLISECDWTQVDDTPLSNSKKLEWATYRQALRDIPSQIDFPWDITWPTKP
jgi:hypothetical protein